MPPSYELFQGGHSSRELAKIRQKSGKRSSSNDAGRFCSHRLIGSRNLTNSCRVRYFTAKELVKPEAKDWWNLVKVICTQPFNSRVQYGVAFVMLHLVGGKKKDKPLVPAAFQKQIQGKVQKKEPPKMLQLGMFKLREEFPGSVEGSSAGRSHDSLTTMARRKKPRNRNQDALLYDKPNEKLEHKLAEDCVRKHREKDAMEEREQRRRPSSRTFSLTNRTSEKKNSARRDRTSDIKKPKLDKDQDREEDEERKRKPVTYKSLNNLFEKVVLVISGIQNPERANLRNQALAMGAKYKSDWDSSCTYEFDLRLQKYPQVQPERSDSAGEIVDEARRPELPEMATVKDQPIELSQEKLAVLKSLLKYVSERNKQRTEAAINDHFEADLDPLEECW
ncbi:conserved hypothetical protein [Culex quinquefasciatus]|uniref:DNA-repair protein Xrcc1 N-terminal domain-containing protein n=1 Tax=Culex quinquefasciatus TaxID=7176 RepID=B0XLF0_CULQU|nr:conserved hypothetical protein [Culex quinquefasciatus]|eukprot:XP_001870472.1 conserved hypothetical protein [Culex quinquefasciatus]